MNDDLISRSWLLAQLDGLGDTRLIKRNFVALVTNAPTVDAVPVVRCRDCKYWGDEFGELQRSDGVLFARCKAHNYLIAGWCPTESDFCSYGEQKDGVWKGVSEE